MMDGLSLYGGFERRNGKIIDRPEREIGRERERETRMIRSKD